MPPPVGAIPLSPTSSSPSSRPIPAQTFPGHFRSQVGQGLPSQICTWTQGPPGGSYPGSPWPGQQEVEVPGTLRATGSAPWRGNRPGPCHPALGQGEWKGVFQELRLGQGVVVDSGASPEPSQAPGVLNGPRNWALTMFQLAPLGHTRCHPGARGWHSPSCEQNSGTLHGSPRRG